MSQSIPNYFERIYTEHHNQTFLIDGSRGSGKTTVLLRLIQEWQQNHLSTGKRWEGRDDEWRGRADPSCNIVPLRILDLEAMSDGTKLLVEVAQTLRLVATALADIQPEDGHARFSRGSKVLEAWNVFFRAAAAESVGSLDSRRPHADLETLVYELDESLRSFLDVRPAFYAFVDVLIEEYQLWHRSKREPLFVIPIDDADMNPQRSAELLNLTRQLWHPRLVFLMTGDIVLFRTALRAYYLSTLRGALQHKKFSDADLKRLGDFDRSAELTEAMLDKAIPVNQRFRVHRVDEAFAIRILLQNDLANISFEHFPNESLRGPDGERRGERTPVQLYLEHDHLARMSLLHSIRNVTDLGSWILRHGSKQIPALCVGLWELGLDHSTLDPRERKLLRNAVRQEAGALVVDPTCVEWEPLAATDRPLVFEGRRWPDFYLMQTTELRARVASRGEDPFLRRIAAGALMFATDIVADHKEWRIARMPGFGSRCLALVETHYQGSAGDAHFQWPTPDWPAFIDQSQLIATWDEWLRQLSTGQELLDERDLLFQFMIVVGGVALTRFPPRPESDFRRGETERATGQRTSGKDALPERAARMIVELQQSVGEQPRGAEATRRNANRRWLRSLGLLLYPEYGLRQDLADEWRAMLEKAKLVTDIGDPELKNFRLRQAMRALRGSESNVTVSAAEKLLEEIDRRPRSSRPPPAPPPSPER